MASLSLNTIKVHQARAAINRLHIIFHLAATLTLLHYRVSTLFHGDVPLFAWGLMTTSESIFAFFWLLSQAFRWRPVTHASRLENIPGDAELPGVDVFVCTADPKKEPTVEVMNTVLSAMALDYPPEKLAVYLSDDGGSSSTFVAIKEACLFARCWIPFCRKYGVKTRCPEAYFSSYGGNERLLRSDEFKEEEINIKIIHDNKKDELDDDKIPLLVYMSREKRPLHPHHFKAGALNALLRVSGLMSNGPYLLVLDCDMYCNDPTSAKQAMCFHLDPEVSPSLAFVQYPQIFYNVSKNDIYDGQARSAYKTKWQGMDGLRGPMLTGTGYYLKRKSLYGSPNNQEDVFLHNPENNSGLSSKFIASLKGTSEHHTNGEGLLPDTVLEEARNLASCTFEKGTKWGKEIGYSYDCLLESTITSYLLHTRGWKSVYLYPERPCFLGSTTIDMKDAMVQQMKWSSGSLQLGLSRLSPLTYGISRMSTLQSMCYTYFTLVAIQSFAFLLYGTVPQLCLLSGIPLYPKVSDPWFGVFLSLYLSSHCQHLYEVLFTGGSLRTWWNEQRIWMIKSVTGCLFGCLDALMKWVGIAKVNFRLTNKAIDQEKLVKYKKGEFDFKGAELFMVPLVMLVMLNLACFIGGVRRVIAESNLQEMFGQVFLSSFVLVLSYPILEGLIPKKDSDGLKTTFSFNKFIVVSI
ncbi:cellulose synthase-like protein G3 isoform X2 [Diospyros lotus]|uniref:cellulose synthase-like protein G3 isoform X2 n=1 Tax=Diospyros lotus TaxID=55363 RepID=UPI0022597105|nr:cellulose synthase-like protein G3 isoform X2 [Diospyros lotus]